MNTTVKNFSLFAGLSAVAVGVMLGLGLSRLGAQTTNAPEIVPISGTGSGPSQFQYINVDTNGVLASPAAVYGPFYPSNAFSYVHPDGSAVFRQDTGHPGVSWDGTGNANLYSLTIGNGDLAHGAGVVIASLKGDGRSITNQILQGPTNGTAPGDAATIKAWANFTNASGGVFKLPLYQ